MSLLTIFNQVWIWALSLFGSRQGANSPQDTFSATDSITVLKLQDISSTDVSFISTHKDFYTDLSLRHGAPNFKLHFHFMSGAAVYLPAMDKNLLFERVFYSLDPGFGHRALVDKSFVIYTPWTADWTAPLGPPELLPVNETIGSIYADDFPNKTRCMEGPEDPRVIYDDARSQVHINFNILTPGNDRQMFGKSFTIEADIPFAKMETEDIITAKPADRLIQFQHTRGYRAGTEKNWVPLMIQGDLHYIYSLAPLRILKCEGGEDSTKAIAAAAKNDVTDYKQVCSVQFKGEAVDSGSQTGALRSGTNWIEHSPGVFFSLARTRFMHKRCSHGLYRPHLIVMKFDIDPKTSQYTKPRIIYASEPITRFDDDIFQLYRDRGLGSGEKCDDRAVLTPGSISHWSAEGDEADVIISVNDDMNVLLKLSGLGAIVQAAVDSEPNLKRSRLLARKNAVTVKAEREMKNFIEKSFARFKKN